MGKHRTLPNSLKKLSTRLLGSYSRIIRLRIKIYSNTYKTATPRLTLNSFIIQLDYYSFVDLKTTHLIANEPDMLVSKTPKTNKENR